MYVRQCHKHELFIFILKLLIKLIDPQGIGGKKGGYSRTTLKKLYYGAVYTLRKNE